MRKDEWQKAFGDPPAGFRQSVEAAVSDLEEKKVKKISFKAALVAAVVLALLTGTALALTRGISVLDFMGGTPLPEADGLVQDLSGVAQAETPLVRYTMRDAIVEDQRVALTLVAEAVDPEKYLLIGGDECSFYTAAGSGKSYEQLARESGRTLLAVGFPNITVNGRHGVSGTADFTYEEQEGAQSYGRLVYYAMEEGLGKLEDDLQISVALNDSVLYESIETKEADGSTGIANQYGEISRTEMNFALNADEARQQTRVLRVEGPFAGDRLDVEWVEFTLTPVATHMRARYTVHEDVTKEQAQDMEFMSLNWMQSADDTQFPDSQGGYAGMVGAGADYYYDSDGNYHHTPQGRTYVEYAVYPAVKELPDTIWLRPYYKAGTEWGEAIRIDMAQAGEGNADVVYMTYGGQFYHAQPDCSGLQGAIEATVGEAEIAGKIPCPVCAG